MKPHARITAFLSLIAVALLLAWATVRYRSSPGSDSRPVDKSPVESVGKKMPQDAKDPSSGDPTPGRAQPAAGQTDLLKKLRREFQPVVRVVGTADASRVAVELESHRIFMPADRTLELSGNQSASSAYIIQFAGPVRAEWKEAVTKAGGRIHGYIPHNALSVHLPAAAAKNLFRNTAILGIFPFKAEYKIQPFLAYLVELKDPGIPELISVTINTHMPSDAAVVARELESKGLRIQLAEAGRRWGLVRAEVPRHEIYEIASWPAVQWVEEYVSPRFVNDRAPLGAYMNVTNVWNTYGLNGAGQIIGHADTGLDVGNYTNIHPDFSGRIVAAYARGRLGRWDDPDGHGTHTAGSILGSGLMSTGAFRGIAWAAGLVHQSVLDNGGGLGGLPGDLNELYLQAYTNGARIHADSWGSSVFGYYTTDSRQSDEFMWDHPDMLLVFAAGNDGLDYFFSADGVVDSDSIGSPATAKNILTVGAAEGGRAPGSGGLSSYTYGNIWGFDYSLSPINGDYISQPHDLTNQGMAAFSSRGPTDDGRIKPDVVAPGTDIVSTRSRQAGADVIWGAHPNASYSFAGGTSMSTPLVAGAAALVRQYFADYRSYDAPSAALVKAALMHGARTLTPGQYGTGAAREIPAQSPNSVEGWGQVNVEDTLFPESVNWFYHDQKAGLSSPGQLFTSVFFAATGTVKITLNYTDFPALAGTGLKLVNDLDLGLSGPGLSTNLLSSDRTNNVERIEFEIGVPGIYTAVVEAVNVPSGPQPFALLISGPVLDAPVIEHEPLQNQYDTNLSYLVSARVIVSVPLETNAVFLFWREISSTSGFQQIYMANVGGNLYEASIPAQPNPSEVEYYIAASNQAFAVYDPAGAPTNRHSFLVNDPLILTVSGYPAEIFSVNPAYGSHLIASGNVVQLSGPAYSNVSPGLRLAIAGWNGTGSVPASGSTNAVAVLFETNSTIQWQWVNQYSLTQTSSVAGIVSAVSWWNLWSAAATVTAQTEVIHNSTEYGLAGWRVDGARHPNNTAVSQNPASGIVMFGPRVAEAVYLPAAQDANTNSIPDWWEQFYFGTNAAAPGVDADSDGFSNLAEYQDRTNPRDNASFPQPPVLMHVPLSDPQTSPAPWQVMAAATDNAAVSNVFLHWQRNGGAWTSVVMSAMSETSFAASISAPGTNTDAFAYYIDAVDYAGLSATSGVHVFSVGYPLIHVAPSNFGTVDVPALSISNVILAITNPGAGTLVWSMDRALFFDHVESGTNGWVHSGINDVWNIHPGRYYSKGMAWHFGAGPGGLYPDAADASLYMPAIYLDKPADLIFKHWAKMEYDVDQNDDHYWDGGVVEISTNGGTTYEQIFPEGGYPHRITDNPDSPFPPDTPCFGKTEGWEPALFDLTVYTGKTVNIRFRFGADFYVRDEGWYIDDVAVRYRDDSSWFWINIPTNGMIAAHQATNLQIELNATGLALAEERRALLVIENNDPERQAPVVVPITIHNATREILVSHSANGAVSPSGVVWVMRGENASWNIQGDPLYMISAVYTNGEIVSGLSATTTAAFTWMNVQSNGTLHVDFTDNIVLGLVPEWWLVSFGLTNPPPEAEAVLDHDGDGMLSWQEYVAGTDPTNAGSVAVVAGAITENPQGRIFSWMSYTNPGIMYDVEVATNLIDGFSPLFTNIPATPPVNTITNDSTNTFEVLRVRIVWP